MEIKFNKLDRSYRKHKKEYDKAVLDTLSSGWYILGKSGELFEKEFSHFLGSKYCAGLNSGFDALTIAFRALGIKEGDEVLVPANTYIASVLGITENGAVPVLVEPDEYYNLDAEKLESHINENTKAILAVHLYGQSANMEKIKAVAEKHNLYLVEDCAQSHGAEFNGKMTGTWGDIGCFSFYPTKNIGAFGDSGAIVTDNLKLYEKVKMIRNYGSEIKYENKIKGVNSRLDEIQASLLSVRLRHYPEALAEREKIAKRYLENIRNEKVALPKVRSGATHVWHLFVVSLKDRRDFQDYLSRRGVDSQIHYPIPPHLSEAYSDLEYSRGDFPVAESFSDTVLSLPLYEGMTEEEIDYVIEVINAYQR
jgi:dTDP-4-amino-4,6-dideoxygalactose transaminase